MKFFMGMILGIALTIAGICGLNYYSASQRTTAPEQVQKTAEAFVDDVDDAFHGRGEIKIPTLIRL